MKTTNPVVEIPQPELSLGWIRYESGKALVRIKLGVLVKDIEPPTARALAIALIHHAEVASMPPPDAELDDEGSGVPAT